MKCETVEVRTMLFDDLHEEQVDVRCENVAIGTTEDGIRVCSKCAEIFRHEGFRVDEDSKPEREARRDAVMDAIYWGIRDGSLTATYDGPTGDPEDDVRYERTIDRIMLAALGEL
jgi:hypothetical protein